MVAKYAPPPPEEVSSMAANARRMPMLVEERC